MPEGLVLRIMKVVVAVGASAAIVALITPSVASAAQRADKPPPTAAGIARSPERSASSLQSVRSAVSCPPLKLFGVRGSGETKSDYSGYGQTVWDVEQTVLDQVPGAKAEEVNYPAIPVVYPSAKHIPSFLQYIATRYHASEITGIKNLTNAVSTFISACPASYVVLAGYSQGAQVVGDTFLSHLTAAQRARIAGIAMLGDADFNGHSSVDIGSYSSGLSGVWAFDHSRRHVANALSNKVASYCTQGDPICNFGVGNVLACHDNGSLCPHVHYMDLYWRQHTYVVDAGDFLVARYHSLVPPVVIGPKKNVLLYGDNDPTDNDLSGMSNLASRPPGTR